MKKIKMFLIALFMMSFFLIDGYTIGNTKSIYSVKISSWMNPKYEQTYECDVYVKEGNTYKLYNERGVLIAEITFTEGYVIVITINKKSK